jgi:hypothetical protein
VNQYRREFLVKFAHAYPPHSTTLVALRRHGKLIAATQQRHTWAMDAEVRRFPTREGKTDRAGFQVVNPWFLVAGWSDITHESDSEMGHFAAQLSPARSIPRKHQGVLATLTPSAPRYEESVS